MSSFALSCSLTLPRIRATFHAGPIQGHLDVLYTPLILACMVQFMRRMRSGKFSRCRRRMSMPSEEQLNPPQILSQELYQSCNDI
jgi:hypothetical protein